MNLKIIENVFTSKFVGPGPSSYKKRIYRAAVSQRLRNTVIETGYGLDGPGIESQSGCDFSHTSRPVLGLTQPPVQWVPGPSGG
jgi:hypothetical protein